MSNTDSTTTYSAELSYAVYGHHKGQFFPDVTGCYTRNVGGEHVPAVIEQAKAHGWWNLSASPEAF